MKGKLEHQSYAAFVQIRRPSGGFSFCTTTRANLVQTSREDQTEERAKKQRSVTIIGTEGGGGREEEREKRQKR
jgi:hypothetical protein